MREKRTHTCMRNWVTMLYSRKLTEHCKPGIVKKKNKNHYIKKEDTPPFYRKPKKRQKGIFPQKSKSGTGRIDLGGQGGGGGGGGGWDGELGVNACPLWPWEWISNEILLCSAGYNV